MTKAEALEAMKEGKKVTHRYFTADEWMTIENGLIKLEDGVKCSITEFFKWRTGDAWDDGYSLYN